MPKLLTRSSRSHSFRNHKSGKRDLVVDLVLPTILLEGIFDVELIHAATGLVKRKLRFRNTITNAGLDFLGTAPALELLMNRLAVGTGNTAPAVGQTALVTELARTASNNGNADVATTGADYRGLKRTREFTTAEANGNLTELGWFISNDNTINTGTMFVRQLFKDNTGTPTVITKTNLDILRVIYELRMHFPTVDVAGSVTVNAVNYTTATRAVGISDGWVYSGTFHIWNTSNGLGVWPQAQSVIESNVLVAQNTQISGQTSDSIRTAGAYVNGNYYRDIASVYNASTAVFATGVGSFLGTLGNRIFQTTFTPKLPKSNLQQLTINARFSWGRYP